MENDGKQLNLFDPGLWGLPDEVVDDLADCLRHFWLGFSHCCKTQTRDTSENGWVYMRGLLIMKTNRNYANIARRVMDPDNDGQNLQQFMSDSPWSEQAIFEQIQHEIEQRPELSGGMLTVDESGDERAGVQSAGAGRQYLGRLGKVDVGQVGVAAGYYKDGTWAMVDAELYLPEDWFNEAHAELRRRWHIPAERTFATKPALALQQIRRAKARGLPFAVIGCDSLYGRNHQFRADLETEGFVYMADIPADLQVYLAKPVVGIPETPPGKRGRPISHWQVLSEPQPVEVRTLVTHPDVKLQPVGVRYTERGLLTYDCAARRVWTLTETGQVREEWLLIRRETDDTFSFSLSNAPAQTPLAQLALWRCMRYFAERIFQDAKSEGGWDELVARKYRAWVHHTALDALALWFIAQTKLEWAKKYPRDPALRQQLEVESLPALSMANIREMLEAAMPLPQLSLNQARHLVIKHLVHRSLSTRSRLKAQRQNRAPT